MLIRRRLASLPRPGVSSRHRRATGSRSPIPRDALFDPGWTEGEGFAYHELGEEGRCSSDIRRKIRGYGIVEEFLTEHL